jgi:hypothetical protein
VSRTATAVATIADQSAPIISDLAVDTATLWPPNHKMNLVTVAYTAVDNCGAVTADLLVSSRDSRGGDAQGLDPQVVDAHHLLLAADVEREYLITVVATDPAGNASASSIAIRVGGPSR